MPATHEVVAFPVNAVTAIAWRDRAVSAEVDRDALREEAARLKVKLDNALEINRFLYVEIDRLDGKVWQTLIGGLVAGTLNGPVLAGFAWLLGWAF